MAVKAKETIEVNRGRTFIPGHYPTGREGPLFIRYEVFKKKGILLLFPQLVLGLHLDQVGRHLHGGLLDTGPIDEHVDFVDAALIYMRKLGIA